MHTMWTELVTGPSTEPVELDQAKEHLRIDGTDEDEYLTRLICDVRAIGEQYTRKRFITQTWDQWFDAQCAAHYGDRIPLADRPIQSITGLYWYDQDGNETEIDASLYTLHASEEPEVIMLSTWGGWPAGARETNSFRIRYVAGYADDCAGIPGAIRRGMYQLIADLYEQRWSEREAGTLATPSTVAARAFFDLERHYLV